MGAEGHFGVLHAPPQTAAIPPSEQLIMQVGTYDQSCGPLRVLNIRLLPWGRQG